MSRIAKAPIPIPAGVEVAIQGAQVTVKGVHGTLVHQLHPAVSVRLEENMLYVKANEGYSVASAQSGTARALLNNMVFGVANRFEKRLQLIGVGYKAQLANKTLTLSLGFSHPVLFEVPESVSVECTTATEIILKSHNKAQLGQVAANIRSFRPPEPYKGKGIRYHDEVVRMKEAKKK